MLQTIFQYVIIIALVAGVGYLVYLLRDRGATIDEDYFGIANSILSMLISKEKTPENIKKILRSIATATDYIESNVENQSNQEKEDKALILAKESIALLNFESVVSDDSIRYLIRIIATLLPSKK